MPIHRGRKSTATMQIEALKDAMEVTPVRGPPPPSELTSEEAAEWNGIVGAMPSEHFTRENYPLLAQLCRETCRARRFAMLLSAMERMKKFDLQGYRDLIKTETQITIIIGHLSMKLRLAQQATIDKSHRKNARLTMFPWEDQSG